MRCSRCIRTASGCGPANGLSDAPVPAGLRRQHEREVAAADQGHGRADDDEGRDLEIHGPAADGRAKQFTFPMDVKSVITSPSGGQQDAGRGALPDLGHRVVGVRARFVASRCRPTAARAGRRPRSPSRCCRKAFARFRIGVALERRPGRAQSRAVDEHGSVQPTRAALLAARGAQYRYHYNAIQSWSVAAVGRGAQCLCVDRAAPRALLAAVTALGWTSWARRSPRARRRDRGSACPRHRPSRELGHQHRPDGAGSAARLRHGQGRRGGVRGEMPRMPRRGRRGQAKRSARRRAGHAARRDRRCARSAATGRTRRPVRLHSPRDAVRRAAVAHERRDRTR